MKRVMLWILTLVSAALFVLAGSMKLLGVPTHVQVFAAIGIGQWFRYFTGTLEVIGAVALFVPALAPYAALLLATVMIGAVITHLFVIGGSPLVPVFLLASTLAIAWLRRQQISSWPSAIGA
jgi:putative oxidoreductase